MFPIPNSKNFCYSTWAMTWKWKKVFLFSIPLWNRFRSQIKMIVEKQDVSRQMLQVWAFYLLVTKQTLDFYDHKVTALDRICCYHLHPIKFSPHAKCANCNWMNWDFTALFFGSCEFDGFVSITTSHKCSLLEVRQKSSMSQVFIFVVVWKKLRNFQFILIFFIDDCFEACIQQHSFSDGFYITKCYKKKCRMKPKMKIDFYWISGGRLRKSFTLKYLCASSNDNSHAN